MPEREILLLSTARELIPYFQEGVERVRTLQNDPLRPVEVMVQNHDTARWLRLNLASHAGICANLAFVLPFDWLWRQARRSHPDLPQVLPSDPGPLQLKLFAMLRGDLPGHESVPELQDVRRAVLGQAATTDSERSDRTVMTVAGRLAKVLDGYQNYRPDLLLDWQDGKQAAPPESAAAAEVARWQAGLWRWLEQEWLADSGRESSRAWLFNTLRSEAEANRMERKDSAREASDAIPLLVFNCRLIPPPVFDQMNSLEGGYRIYGTSPFAGRADSGGMRAALKRPDTEGTLSAERFRNELLRAWGQEEMVRATQLSGGAARWAVVDGRDLKRPGSTAGGEKSHLSRIQESIRADEPLPAIHPNGQAAPVKDGSIRVHACHGRLREVETLHATLLELFERHPDLRPEQIAVVAPDINRYAAQIHAVFGTPVEGLPSIPYKITESNAKRAEEPAGAFLLLLELMKSRFSRDGLLDLIRMPCVHEAIGLDARSVERIAEWALDNRVHWGLGPEHRGQLGQPKDTVHTWQSLADRCWTAHFWGGDSEGSPEGTPPFPDPDGQEDVLRFARFSLFLERLESIRTQTLETRTLRDWMDRFQAWASLVTGGGDVRLTHAIDRIRSDAEISGTTGLDVDFETATLLLTQILARTSNRIATFIGGIQFASMVSARNLPFRVVCLIGLHQDTLPSPRPALDYDLLESDPRLFERSHRREERGMFLEYLMAAEDVFYCSYSGRSEKDDQKLDPSPVLSDWIRSLGRILGLQDPSTLVAHERLHGFSSAYLEPEPLTRHPVYARAGRQIKLHRLAPTQTPRLQLPETLASASFLDTEGLMSFMKDPSREFLKQRLGANLREPIDSGTEFELTGLETYKLAMALMQWELEGRDEEWQFRRLAESGWLPRHLPGHASFRSLHAGIRSGLDRLQAKLGRLHPAVRDVRFEHKGMLVKGRHHVMQIQDSPDIVLLHSSELHGSKLIEGWVHSVLFNHLAPSPVNVWLATGLKQSSKKALHVLAPPESPEKSLEHLEQLLALYTKGMRRPLRFFPKTAYQWWTLTDKSGAPPDPMDLTSWIQETFSGGDVIGESLLPSVQCLYGPESELDPEIDYPTFESILTPCMAQLNEEKL